MTVNAITDTKKGRTGIAPTYLHTTPPINWLIANQQWRTCKAFLIFKHYSDEFERSERVVLDRRNPFDEYDDVKFRQRFRLSKFAVTNC